MDNHLYRIPGRPVRLRRQDLPLVARALIALFRKRGIAKTGVTENIRYVRIEMPTFQVQILAEDWAKIMPHIRDQSFDHLIHPSQIDPAWVSPATMLDEPIIDQSEHQYYLKILRVLQGLFPEAYPVSAF